MNPSERQVVDTALRILDGEGFDVKAIWRALAGKDMARLRAEDQPAPLSSLSLNLDAVLLASSDPLLTLRQRGAALTKEIDRLSLEIDREEAKKLSVSLRRGARKAINSKIADLKAELRARKLAQREALSMTVHIAANERIKESARMYDLMRDSKAARAPTNK